MTEMYRVNIGIMLVNNEGKVFVGKRVDTSNAAWQMPQGGVDEGEEPETALFREMYEEVGIEKDKVALISIADEWLSYDFPQDVRTKLWEGNYKGQKQKWFLLHFIGNDRDINLNTSEKPEFCEYKWVDPKELPSLAVSFKKDVYQRLLNLFQEDLGL
ncbi:MAG: RNA pyrophosphohydrolase [Alphaproteobacteria bacterium]